MDDNKIYIVCIIVRRIWARYGTISHYDVISDAVKHRLASLTPGWATNLRPDKHVFLKPTVPKKKNTIAIVAFKKNCYIIIFKYKQYWIT